MLEESHTDASAAGDSNLYVQVIKQRLPFHVLVLVGPPLAGKGTQAARLSQLLGIPAVSTGDLFRQEAATGSELGIQMKSYMDRGELIPNDLTTKFLVQKLSHESFQAGLILDGYPRNPSHLPILDSILADLDRKIFAVLHFHVDKQILLERLDERLVCAKCGAIHSTKTLKPFNEEGQYACERCNALLVHRTDDSKDVFERRLSVYEAETIPLVSLLEERQLLVRINCQNNPDQVTNQILHQLWRMEERSQDNIDAYQWLLQRINNPRYQVNTLLLDIITTLICKIPSLTSTPYAVIQEDEAERASMLRQFRDKALYENRFHRSGILRRFVYLKTSNLQKYQEHLAIFERFYGIEVLRTPPELPDTFVKTLLEQRSKGLVPLAVIREESNLYRPNTDIFSTLSHNVKAINRATLCSFTLKNGSLQTKVYTHQTVGRIDLTRRKSRTTSLHDGVFGWDDIFVLESNGMSYQDLLEYGIKNSSRSTVISEFLKDNIYYEHLLDVEFNKQLPRRPIDFGISVADFVEKNVYYNNKLAIDYGYRNLQTHVLNFGVFFRAARNRRQNNYWNPGLNGGIPLTKKADEIHEITFMAHDFGHFAIPDLIYVGRNSVNHRRAYIAWRMISEATTMALADMLFIDSLAKTGVDYNFNARRIYPLFKDLNINFLSEDNEEFVANLKKVIRANYLYCLKGDNKLYLQLLQESGANQENLTLFEEKYMPFFVEDFRWTEHNYDNMAKRSEELRRWWKSIKPLRNLTYLNLKSIDAFLKDVRSHETCTQVGDDAEVDQFIDRVFEVVFEQKVKPVLQNQATLLPERQRLQRGFTRWMAGQLAICSKFHFIPESKVYQDLIIENLLKHEASGMDLDVVNGIRAIYEEYLQLLVDKSFISQDDQATFADLYPLFDPLYVSYDKGASNYENLAQVSRRVFATETHREKQFVSVERIINRSLLPKEKSYLSHASLLTECANGHIEDGLFVFKPGVLLQANTVWTGSNTSPYHDLTQVTFLLSGVSVETSLELVAHKEAKVARLTSSKTQAMNMPLFRIQGDDTWHQKKYLESVLRHRSSFEAKHQPRKKGHNGNELFNLSLPSCKATALCYSMTLKDYHSLFIGRMGSAGNEEEVREVVRSMAHQLHQRFPNYILSPDAYLNFNNAEKYKSKCTASCSSPGPEVDAAQPSGSLRIEQVADTILAPEAVALFKLMGINTEQPAYIQLSEFRSRITYLAFPFAGKGQATKEESEAYLRKMTQELNHLSILAGVQVGFLLHFLQQGLHCKVLPLLQKFGAVPLSSSSATHSTTFLLLVTLKELHQMLLQWGPVDKDTAFTLADYAHKLYPAAIRDPEHYCCCSP